MGLLIKKVRTFEDKFEHESDKYELALVLIFINSQSHTLKMHKSLGMMGCYRTWKLEQWGEKVLLGSFIESLIF